MRGVSTSVCLLVGCGLLASCADASTRVTLPTPDAEMFQLEVYPVLLRDCGFPACHGKPARFFRVFGPGRTRLQPEQTQLFAPATGEEIEEAYYRASSMLTHEGDIEQAPLLRKPLEAGHAGSDEWGNNVYRSARDPGYATLSAWARTVQSAEDAEDDGDEDEDEDSER